MLIFFVGANECLRNPCGINTKCRDVPGGFECLCDSGCTGDPYRGCVCPGTQVNLCDGIRCGNFAECRVKNNLEPECYCPRTHPLGDPYVECRCLVIFLSLFKFLCMKYLTLYVNPRFCLRNSCRLSHRRLR